MKPTVSEARPTPPAERIELLDVLRGLAVAGILIGNMQWFSGYGMVPPALALTPTWADHVTHFLVHVLIEGKFYSIFSFLFGFGFAVQITRAEDRGDTNATLFKRRLLWLLVIGFLHGFLLWAGDILSVYALMGFVLLLFRNRSDRSLLKSVLVLMIVPVLWYALLLGLFVAFAPPDITSTIETAMIDQWHTTRQTVSQGGYWQIISEYNLTYIIGRYIGLVMQMRLPKILAMFLLGVYAYRRGFLHDPAGHRSFLYKVAVYGLLVGVIGNLILAATTGNEAQFPPSVPGFVGVIGYSFGVPALALALIALVATLWQKVGWQRLLSFLAPVGRMALTNYLMQTVICVVIFYGYGFGQFGKIGALQATLTALVIFAVQVLASMAWLKFFAYGPMEWIWRQLTYRKRLRLTRAV